MKQHSYKHDIILSLIIKLSLISLIWWLCFSHPLDKNLQPNTISTHLFNTNINQLNTATTKRESLTSSLKSPLTNSRISNSNTNTMEMLHHA
jgi:hypothetical protein